MIALTILNPRDVVFEGDVESLFLPGDKGEFELLPFHAPMVSLLKDGDIVIDWKTRISIKNGIAKILNDECVVLLEE
jgi:F-type H+-transporting ATPase subunit epsilon